MAHAFHPPQILDCIHVSLYLCVYLPLPLHLNLSSNWPFYAHEHTLDIISISRAISVAKQFITNYAHSVSSCWWQRVTSSSAASCSWEAALARSCQCSVLHGAVPQPPANDAAARQNVAAHSQSARPAYQPAHQQQLLRLLQLLPLLLLLLSLMGTTQRTLPPAPPRCSLNHHMRRA